MANKNNKGIIVGGRRRLLPSAGTCAGRTKGQNEPQRGRILLYGTPACVIVQDVITRYNTRGEFMVFETTIRRIGNSQGVTIPKEICDDLSLPVGSRVRIESRDGGIVIMPARGRTLRDRLSEWDGVRYESPETDWGEPVGSEMW